MTCPFLTAVGATQINPGSTVNDPESACEQVIFSGGGFSNFFALPSYQANAVTTYLTEHKPTFTSAQFNNSGQVSATEAQLSSFLSEHFSNNSLEDSLILRLMGALFVFTRQLQLTGYHRANYIIGAYILVDAMVILTLKRAL